MEKMENAPHLPRWMSGQCKLINDILGGLGEEWVAEDMEGVVGGAWTDNLDVDIDLTDPEDGGTQGISLRGGLHWDGSESTRV